jgi:hypothetical protein
MSASLVTITHEVLKERLRRGSVRFYFRKTDGTLRIAMGTLDLTRVPTSGQPKGGNAPQGVTSFFDLEKSAWRSVSHTQQIWID